MRFNVAGLPLPHQMVLESIIRFSVAGLPLPHGSGVHCTI